MQSIKCMKKKRAQKRMEMNGDKNQSSCALSSDVQNAALLVLGHHDKCLPYYCNIVSGSAAYPFPQIDIPAKLRIVHHKAANIVCNKSRSLVVYDQTSNLAV